MFVGNIYNSDEFYRETLDRLHKFMEFGVLGVEMESTALYTLAAKYGVKALSILTVGSQLLTNESLTHEESEKSFLIWWTLLFIQSSMRKGLHGMGRKSI